MKSPLTTSLRKQTPINKKAIPYMTINKSNFTYMKTSNKKTKNLATPGKPMSQDEFVSLIKEAEEGEFMSVKEFKERFDKWRAERKK
jgi:hypothetical protein